MPLIGVKLRQIAQDEAVRLIPSLAPNSDEGIRAKHGMEEVRVIGENLSIGRCLSGRVGVSFGRGKTGGETYRERTGTTDRHRG